MKYFAVLVLLAIAFAVGFERGRETADAHPVPASAVPVPAMPTLTIGPKSDPMGGIQSFSLQNHFALEPQCKGIAYIPLGGVLRDDADFTLLTFGNEKNLWTWTMAYNHDPSDPKESSHGNGGFGSQPKIEDVTRDICLTMWDDLHRPYPVQMGGTIR